MYDESGNLSGLRVGSSEYYYYRNGQGDIIGIIDSTGSIAAKYSYDAWGNPVAITDGNGNDVSGNAGHIANINPFRYRGYFYDIETGLYYLQSRYYDSQVGRFVNADGIIGANDYALFNYCGNNPIMLSDPSGMIGWEGCMYMSNFNTISCAQSRKDNLEEPITHVSDDVVDFISSYEGYETSAKDDGYGNLTIGYGHVVQDNEHFGKISKEEALRLLKQDLDIWAGRVYNYSYKQGVVWDQHQIDALVSFAFNTGYNYEKLIGHLLNYENPYESFGLYIKAYNRKTKQYENSLGLYRRRYDEAVIFTQGIYERTYRNWQ